VAPAPRRTHRPNATVPLIAKEQIALLVDRDADRSTGIVCGRGRRSAVAGEPVELVASRDHGSSPVGTVSVDRVGALVPHYARASVAFIGGSLVPHGGHSPLEALAAGCPVIVGPYLEHVESLVVPFAGSGSITMLRDAASLTNALAERLALPPHERERQRFESRAILDRQRGAAARVVDWLDS
jgi:3-deoxy-D-manno-octulosonic-acid transferase